MLTFGTGSFMRIGSTVISKIAVVCISIGMTARGNLCISAMLTGIANETVHFLTGTAVCASVRTRNRFCVFLICFLCICCFQIVRTGMFAVGTRHRTRCRIGAAVPARVPPTCDCLSAGITACNITMLVISCTDIFISIYLF